MHGCGAVEANVIEQEDGVGVDRDDVLKFFDSLNRRPMSGNFPVQREGPERKRGLH